MYFSSDLETVPARLDLGADARVPGSVTVLDHPGQFAVGANGGGDLQALGEGVHAADVGVEKIDRFKALAADLGVEVQSAGA